LEHGFDHYICVAYRLVEVGGGVHSCGGRVGIFRGQASLLDAPIQVSTVGLSRLPELLVPLIVEPDIDAVQRRLLGDLGSHRARADHRQTTHCTEKIRVTVFRVITFGSRPSILSLPVSSFAAMPRPTPS